LEKAQKQELVATMKEAFAASGAIVVAHYKGLTVADMETLRVQMREAGGHIKVAKNRLAKRALLETEVADFSDLLTGPTVLAYSDDPITAPKIVAAFAKKNSKFEILGGAMGTTGLDVKGVEELAKLPSLDELRAKIAGLLTQPAAKIASVVQAPGGQVARVISAYSEEGAAA
jgi:large subunit ribosomal protein L10